VRPSGGEGGALYAFVVAISLLLSAPFASAQSETVPHLCLVSVKNSARSSVAFVAVDDGRFGTHGTASNLGPGVQILPGLPRLILYDTQRAWTVSEDNVLVPFEGPFPHAVMFDQLAVTTVNGQMQGTNHEGVYVLDPGSDRFRQIVAAPFGKQDGSVTGFRFINTIGVIPRLNMTLIGTDNGVFRLRGETVEPLAGATGREVGPIIKIADLPVHGAIMLAGYHSAMLRHDNGSVTTLVDTSGGLFSRAEQIISAIESRQPGRVVVKGPWTLREVEMRPSSVGFSPGHTTTLFSYSPGSGWIPNLVTRAGEYLFLRQSWFGRYQLEHLEPDGMQRVPGDPIANFGDVPSWERPFLWESAALGLVLFQSPAGWYAYDGNQVSLIPGSAADQLGKGGVPRDLPSIGKVVLKTERGVFELTDRRRFSPLQLPFHVDPLKFAVADLPAAHVGVISNGNNLYALTRSSAVYPIEGGSLDSYSFQPFVAVVPGRNAMLIRGVAGMHLIMTSSPAGTVCASPTADDKPGP
jgi:hypothetical protein